MFSQYLLDLEMLPEAEKNKQIMILIIAHIVIFIICIILYFLKKKFLGKTKNKFFQKFLEKI